MRGAMIIGGGCGTHGTDGCHSFDALWKRYYRPLTYFVLCRLSRTLHDDHEGLAEEIVQETMLRVYRAYRDGDDAATNVTWVYTVAGNLCTDAHRKTTSRRTWAAPSDDLDQVPSSLESPEQHYLTQELFGIVDEFIATLADEDRAILMLRYYEGLPYEDIARIVRRPVGTLKYRVHVMRRALRAHVEVNQ